MEKIFLTDIKSPKTVLVTGTGGTMKSSLVYNILSLHLKNREPAAGETPERALYLTLEETEESLVENLESVGIPLNDRIILLDYNKIRKNLAASEKQFDMMYLIETIINSYLESENVKYFILDSLGALQSLMVIADLRREMYTFMGFLRDRKLSSFIVFERGAEDPRGTHEAYIADGLIEMGLVETQRYVRRYIRVTKMRSVHHNMEKYVLEVKEGGINVLGPLYGY